MRRIIVATITMIGSWLGWWLGNHFGIMTAFLLSMTGTGFGLYFGRRLSQF